jgi:hypothetical protein
MQPSPLSCLLSMSFAYPARQSERCAEMKKNQSYDPSPINQPKRKRATPEEMQERREFVVDFCREFSPVSVRGVYYQATVRNLVEKTEKGYKKIQREVLQARREKQIPYWQVTDNSRSFYQVRSHDSLSNAAEDFAYTYKRDFWADNNTAVEVWLEKEALSGVIRPVTNEYRVRMVPTRGFSSETIVHNAVQDAAEGGKDRLLVVTLYDFDRSGQDAEAALVGRMQEFAEEFGIVIQHVKLGLSYQQVIDMGLPTRPAKRESGADKKWPYDFACELDAISPNVLRRMVAEAIEPYMPQHQRQLIQAEEEHERVKIRMMLSDAA